ncbi:MAG: glycosyltransferase family 39 protein, partial [Actinobacteria bacterium]|nr:glycosyltransferase family 39 protein [Actinomycetota bacterium]
AATVVGALVLGALLAVHAIWWAPLNVDEELTRRVAVEPFGRIFHIVSTERGGGPFHFWLEHFLLRWPGGLLALRGASLVFFLATLPAVALIGLELAGAAVAAVAVLLMAAAPLAVSAATFGRPHAMLLCFLEWGTWFGLRAVRTRRARDWVLAGVVLGGSVFVHPTAPVYSLTAFAAVLVYAPRRPRELAREAWPGVVALVVTFLPYYASTLGVLSERYGIGSGVGGRTFTGFPVWHDALSALAPGIHGQWPAVGLAVGGLLVLVATRRARAGLALAAMVLVPIVFFSVVPTNGLSAIFFDRYVLPSLPSFLVLIAVSVATVAGWARRARWPVLVLATAALVVFEARVVLIRQHQLTRLQLNRLTSVVRAESADAVLFGSTGSADPTNYLGNLTFGRPPFLLDRYLGLRIGSLRVIDDDTCLPVVPFLRTATPRYGIWIFYVAPQDSLPTARVALTVPGVTIAQPVRLTLVVRSTRALAPRPLVSLGLELRRHWQATIKDNPRVADLVDADATALRAPATCRGHGFLDDPDISPNWPESLT